MSNIYESLKLDPSRKQVRVLRLHSGPNVEVDLEVVDLDDHPEYTAVSYTWEPENPRQDILVHGEPFSVGCTLSALLHAFREPDRSVVLWVDAICINQRDQQEQESQVRLMKHVYRLATQTLIWIGDASEDSHLAMDYIRSFLPSNFENLSTNPEEQPWPALRQLVRRRWWSRLWVLQEVLLSAKPILCCGTDRISFEQVVALRVSEEQCLTDHVRKFGGLHIFNAGVPLEGCLLSWSEDRRRLQRGGVPLQEWFAWTMSLNHSRAHDRIYGMLGLATQEERNLIPINYDIPVPKLYAQAVVPSFKCYGLETLHCGFSIRNQDLPSWVPDWTAKEFVSYFDKWYRGNGPGPLGRLRAWDRFEGAPQFASWALPSITDQDTEECWAISVDHMLLAVRGIPFDKVAYADAVPFVEAYEGAEPEEYERRRLQREDAAVDASLRWEAQVNSLQDGPYKSREGRYEALWRTIIADRRVDQTGPPGTSFGELFEIWMRRSGPQDRTERRAAMFEYYAAAVTRTASRAFITTKSGYFGLAPGGTKPGDVVAILKGGPVPFVLRPAAEGRYSFVGESYVHGVMRGETLGDTALDELTELWIE